MIFVNYSVIDHELLNKNYLWCGKVTKSPPHLAWSFVSAYLVGSNMLRAYLFFMYGSTSFIPDKKNDVDTWIRWVRDEWGVGTFGTILFSCLLIMKNGTYFIWNKHNTHKTLIWNVVCHIYLFDPCILHVAKEEETYLNFDIE